MDKENLIQLTNNLYRLTLLFPKKEPLRYKMREVADDILASLSVLKEKLNNQNSKSAAFNLWPSEIINNLEVLDSFFEVAKKQNWVSPDEVLQIQEEYNKIKAEIKKISEQPLESTGDYHLQITEVKRPRPVGLSEGGEVRRGLSESRQTLNLRQGKILEILRDKKRIQVWQVKEIFPEISKRTLRRDFLFLLKQGKIERIGQRNNTFYQLKE